MEKNNFYITTPIYYVNDRPHIGHAYTTVAADVVARYWRTQLGEDNVFFLTGTDEHGKKIADAADAQGKTPQEFADEVAADFQDVWQTLHISHNKFIRTTSDEHKRRVQIAFARLQEAQTPKGNAAIYEDEYAGLYCTGCEKFITEKEIENGRCPLHPNKDLEEIKEKNYFFRLTDYLDAVRDKIEKDELRILPAKRKAEVLGLLKQDLHDFSISRESVKWGIALPFDENQVSYVWVEALMNYITGIGFGEDEAQFAKFWPANAQFMAQDILKFHAVYWPALLMALDVPLPKNEFIHGFFTIDGQKMSKSLGNVIDPRDVVARYGTDATRYLLLSQFSFGSEADVQVERFDDLYQAALGNKLGNVVMRVTTLLEKHNEGAVVQDMAVPDDWRVDEKAIAQLYGDYKIDQVLRAVFEKIERLNKELDDAKPWVAVKDEATKPQAIAVLSQAVLALREIAQHLAPFMPQTAEKLRVQLHEPLKKGEPLFPRLEK